MKKYISALLLTVFILLLSPTAYAGDTVLTTSVPYDHTISLDIGSGGSVNGLCGKTEISADRHSKVIFEIKPDSGYKIKSAIYNGEDVTSKVSGGKFIIESVESDGSLKVTFQSSRSPQTGDSSNLAIWSAMLFLSGAAMYLLRKKVQM